MSRARDNANNWAADITAVSAGVGVTGGGTSGAVTVTNDMATTIDAKGDLVVGTGADTYTRVPVGSNNQVLTADSATTSGVKWATADALPSQTGNSGKYLTTDGTTASWGTVTQPLNFTGRFINSNGSAWNAIWHNGSLYVAGGQSGIMATSSDGITWTERTSGFGANNIQSITFGNGLWVAVGDAGIITTSSDGITWTARTSGMGTNTIFHVVYDNSLFVAVGGGGGTTNTGGITYSSNGTSWTRKSQSITVGVTYNNVVWNGTNWIVVASSSTNNYLYASTPSGTWTAAIYSALGSTSTLSKIFWDGTRHIIVRENGEQGYATGTTLATGAAYRGIGYFNAVNSKQRAYLYNNKLYTGEWLISTYTPTSSDSINTYSSSFVNGAYVPASGTPYYDGTIGCMLVNASGIVIGNNYGRIYTSF